MFLHFGQTIVWDKHLFSQDFYQRAHNAVNGKNIAKDQNIDVEVRHDLTLWLWCRLAHLTGKVKEALYPTREYAKQLIDQDIHREAMQQFEPALREWSTDLANCSYSKLTESVSYTHLTLPTKRIV